MTLSIKLFNINCETACNAFPTTDFPCHTTACVHHQMQHSLLQWGMQHVLVWKQITNTNREYHQWNMEGSTSKSEVSTDEKEKWTSQIRWIEWHLNINIPSIPESVVITNWKWKQAQGCLYLLSCIISYHLKKKKVWPATSFPTLRLQHGVAQQGEGQRLWSHVLTTFKVTGER